MDKVWYVYIFDRRGQLYTGISTNLEHRMRQHNAIILYYESFDDKYLAARREKEIKGWSRESKSKLIEYGR
jgi:predicted GIY-YIG superfamily endonuclease